MIEFELPIKIASLNMQSHWTKKHKRSKTNGNAIRFVLNTQGNPPQLPCSVTLTRIAPRALDEEDNLRGGDMKWVKDTIADWLIPGLAPGRADGDKRIEWKYAQEKRKPKEYALRVRIDHVG